MDLNVIRKPPIFLSQVTNFSLRNRPYEALKRIRKNWGWARGTHESLFIFNKYFFNFPSSLL